MQTQEQPRQVGGRAQRVNSSWVDNGSQWLLMERPSLADLALNPKPSSQPDDHGRIHALGACVPISNRVCGLGGEDSVRHCLVDRFCPPPCGEGFLNGDHSN